MTDAKPTALVGETEADPPVAKPPRLGALLRRALEPSLAFVGLLVFTLFGTWPVLPNMATKAIFDPGDPLLSAWLFGWGAHAVVDAPLRIFDANMFNPQGLALAFTENMLGLSLPVAPVFWLTGNALLMENLALTLYIAVAGFGGYLLVREIGAPRSLAFVCGAAYALTPYRIAQLTHPHVVGTHWLPFVLLMLFRLSEPDLPPRTVRRRVAALTVFAALQVWASLTGAAMMAVLVGAWLLWLAVRHRGRVWRPVVRVSAGLFVALLLSTPVLVPYVVLQKRHPGYRHTEAETLSFAARPSSYLVPRGQDGPVLGEVYVGLAEAFAKPSETLEKRLFPGVWLFLACLAGLVVLSARRFRDASLGVLGVVVIAVFFVFSLGPRVGARADGLPLPFLLFQTVFGGLTRVPARFGVVVPLGMMLVAGAGLARLGPRVRTVVTAASLAIVALEMAPETVTMVPAPKITAAHRALADREGVLLALPTAEFDDTAALIGQSLSYDSQHLFLSTAHFRPLVNGNGAFHPLTYWEVVLAARDLPSEKGFEVLRNRDVRTVVVQTALAATSTRWHDVVERMRAWPGVTQIAAAEGVVVFDVTVATAAAGR